MLQPVQISTEIALDAIAKSLHEENGERREESDCPFVTWIILCEINLNLYRLMQAPRSDLLKAASLIIA
jgi:hypothetical protein